jgi:hypothetical protein
MLASNVLSDYQNIPYVPQAALLAANVIPLVGVLFFGWQVSTVLAIFWAETGVIGFYAILRIVYAGRRKELLEGNVLLPTTSATVGKLLFAGFFVFHFGVFMVVHGVFLFTLISRMVDTASQFNFLGVFVGVGSLLVSHGISFYRNYLQSGEYTKMDAKNLMSQPYKRVIVMHFVILLSVFGMQFFGSLRAPALVILVVLKVIFDLRAHVSEHVQFRR